MEVIHLHGQWQWHDEAAIVGNVGGLTLLRDAIDRAIKNGGDGVGIFTSDGEGYHLLVIVSDDIDEAAMPYHDSTINQYGGVKPYQESKYEQAFLSCNYDRPAFPTHHQLSQPVPVPSPEASQQAVKGD